MALPAKHLSASRELASLRKLSKEYKTLSGETVRALTGVDLTLLDGEFVTVVGTSGCGKTTLLKILAGLIRPSSGEVLLRGKPVDGPQRDMGVVFQSPVLLPWRTVLQNVLLPIDVLGWESSKYVERAGELLAMVGLGDFRNKYPNELSGGMQQRAAIVRALVYDPSLLLMDEPFSALDAMTREQMNLDLERIWDRSRKTILFITHNIQEAAFLGDRVVVMSPRPGRIVGVVPVTLPRPRSLELLVSDQLGKVVSGIRMLMGPTGTRDDSSA
jgi:NitT/TauT family transport system ATP-binding protein